MKNHAHAVFSQIFLSEPEKGGFRQAYRDRGESFPLRKYWGQFFAHVNVRNISPEQDEMLLLLNEVVGDIAE